MKIIPLLAVPLALAAAPQAPVEAVPAGFHSPPARSIVHLGRVDEPRVEPL